MKMRSRNEVWHTWRGPVLLLVAALLPALFFAASRDGLHPQAIVWYTLQGMTFAICVGGMAYLTFDRLASHFARFSLFVQWLILLAVLLVCSVAGTALAIGILSVALGASPTWASYVRSFKISLLISLMMGAGSFIIEKLRYRALYAERAAEEERRKAEEARRLATEAQLASLESRIHPHFLFNALNSIAALIREDPAAAERLVERLAALLRSSLDHHRGLVPLSAELKVVTDYLEIERARFGDRLRYSIESSAEVEATLVPAMCIQTLVENAVKHSIATRREGGEVRILARAHGGGVLVDVADDGPGFQPDGLPAGHGLDALASRLQVLFNGSAAVSFHRDAKSMVVSLALPKGQR